MSKVKSFSAKSSLVGVVLSAAALIGFTVYGMVYDYFDTVVFLTLALGMVGMAAYALVDRAWSELLNLAAVACITFGMGLFFLNSYPVWADRLNNISMYGSRGTLLPVITLLVLMVAPLCRHCILLYAEGGQSKMKNNTAPRKTLTAVLAVAMAAGLTGCGSSLAANTNNYFTNVSSILHTLQTNGKQQAASSSTVSNDGSQLATPTDFTVDESGNYSFTGVENAKYYLLYFCAPDATGDNDSFIYTSEPIDATESNTYSGKCSDEFDYAFGSYLAKVYAFPDLTDKEHSMSKGATAEYSCSGNQSAPELNYYWNTFDGTMGIQVANLDVYEFEAYPDKVDITFHQHREQRRCCTLTMENVTPDNNQLDTDALTAGATYDVTAVSTSNSEYVLNQTSDTTKVAEGLHLGESSVMTAGYSYSDGFANNIFNWPRVCESFDLENGGVAA